MKTYITPNMSVFAFESKDVVAASGISKKDGYLPDPENIRDSADF